MSFVIVKIIVIQALINCVLSESTGMENQSTEVADGENSVLDAVYETIKQNYETKLSQNLETLNVISDIRNKSKANETSLLIQENDESFDKSSPPFAFETLTKTEPATVPVNPIQARADHGHEEYHIVHEEHEKKDDDHDSSLYGKKHLLAGLAALAFLFLGFKAIILPLKFWFALTVFAIANSVLAWAFFFRVFRFRRLFGLNNVFGGTFKDMPIESKNKLQTIKEILNSEDGVEEDDDDARGEDSLAPDQVFFNPFDSPEAAEEFVQNLLKLANLKNKNW